MRKNTFEPYFILKNMCDKHKKYYLQVIIIYQWSH